MDYAIEQFEKHNDERGQLVVFLKNSNLAKPEKEFGQIYFVTFDKKGVVRGNHYHKKWREWFGVVTGKLQVILKDVRSGEMQKLVLEGSSKHYVRLKIGPYIAHAFKSISSKAALINYANREWSSKDDFSYKLI